VCPREWVEKNKGTARPRSRVVARVILFPRQMEEEEGGGGGGGGGGASRRRKPEDAVWPSSRARLSHQLVLTPTTVELIATLNSVVVL
jgi:hypothetical protein